MGAFQISRNLTPIFLRYRAVYWEKEKGGTPHRAAFFSIPGLRKPLANDDVSTIARHLAVAVHRA